MKIVWLTKWIQTEREIAFRELLSNPTSPTHSSLTFVSKLIYISIIYYLYINIIFIFNRFTKPYRFAGNIQADTLSCIVRWKRLQRGHVSYVTFKSNDLMINVTNLRNKFRLQTLSYNLCYLYVRCTRSVSLVRFSLIFSFFTCTSLIIAFK